MKKIGFVLLNLLAANTVFAQTSPLSYDYIQAGYGKGEVLDEDFSFLAVGASYSINESFFVTGSYSDGETDDNFAPGFDELKISSYDLGVGFHAPVHQTTDLVVSGSYISSEVDLGPFSEDGDGFGIEGGFRFKPTAQLEFNAFVDYSEVESQDNTGYTLSAYYFLTPAFSLGLTYADDDNADTTAANLRFHF